MFNYAKRNLCCRTEAFVFCEGPPVGGERWAASWSPGVLEPPPLVLFQANVRDLTHVSLRLSNSYPPTVLPPAGGFKNTQAIKCQLKCLASGIACSCQVHAGCAPKTHMGVPWLTGHYTKWTLCDKPLHFLHTFLFNIYTLCINYSCYKIICGWKIKHFRIKKKTLCILSRVVLYEWLFKKY